MTVSVPFEQALLEGRETGWSLPSNKHHILNENEHVRFVAL